MIHPQRRFRLDEKDNGRKERVCPSLEENGRDGEKGMMRLASSQLKGMSESGTKARLTLKPAPPGPLRDRKTRAPVSPWTNDSSRPYYNTVIVPQKFLIYSNVALF